MKTAMKLGILITTQLNSTKNAFLDCKTFIHRFDSDRRLFYCSSTLVQNYALSAQDFQLLHIFRKMRD